MSPGAQAIRAALELFEAKALFDGEECPINLRVAKHGGNSISTCAIAPGGRSRSMLTVGG